MTVTQFEHYLGLTDYLCQYISQYAVIVKLLQLWKTSLNWDLCEKSIRDNAHKRATDRTEVLESTLSELSAFHLLQCVFTEFKILTHFSLKQQLYVDLNALKKWGFETHIYHIKVDVEMKATSESKSMESILFLSWLLINAEIKYWSTELKVTDLVWVVKKIRHMIEAAELPIIVYTDHSVTVFIICQTFMNTTLMKKLNLQLIHTSEYLQWFCLNICYKPDKTNIIPDILSRLTSHDYWFKLNESSLNALHTSIMSIYANTLVEIFSSFCEWIIHSYMKSHWKWVIDMIEWNNELDTNTVTLSYTWIWSLVYYKDIEKNYCLCILTYLYEEIFAMTHDFISHLSYVWTHKWLTDSLYLSYLLKHLHEYLQHCSQCQLMQTSWHHLYELMQSILTSSWSFHVLTIDFILALSASSEDYDTVLSVTDKFSKVITFIPGQKTMTAENWAIRLLNCLTLLNWGLSCAILLNHNRKFTAALWKGLFKCLKIDLLFSAVYHSQMNDSSEITN